MDFSLSEERQLLSDSLTRYLSDQYPIEHRIQAAYRDPYFDPLKWQELVELGVPAALVSEEKRVWRHRIRHIIGLCSNGKRTVPWSWPLACSMQRAKIKRLS